MTFSKAALFLLRSSNSFTLCPPFSSWSASVLSTTKKWKAPLASVLDLGGVTVAKHDVVKDDPTNDVPDTIFAKLGMQLHRRNQHPIGILKNAIYEYFDANYPSKFDKFDDLCPIVTVKQFCYVVCSCATLISLLLIRRPILPYFDSLFQFQFQFFTNRNKILMASNSMSQSNSELFEKQKSNAKWDSNNTKILLKACIEEIRKSGKPGISFKAKRWEAIVDYFNSHANKNYTQKQLKNRMDCLRNDWTLWKNLKGKETGLGWNHETGTIVADDTWWEAKIRQNPKYGKFRTHGLEHHDDLEYIFGDTVATSEHVWTPAMSIPVEDSDTNATSTTVHGLDDIDKEDLSIDEDFSPAIDSQLKRKRMVSEETGNKGAKSKTKGTAAILIRSLERIANAAESHNAIESAEISSHVSGQYSIPECIKLLESLKTEGALSQDQFTWALELIMTEQMRLVLMSLSEKKDQIEWIVYKYNSDKKFNEVLNSLCLLAREIVKPSDFSFREVPSKVRNDRRYWPYFKGCIGAIDGSHVPAIPPSNDQIRFIGRKGYPTHNVMLVCNFDMLFTFLVVGWPGTAHDTRILSTAIEEMRNVFPHPPEGKYYLVDAGYPNTKGYLAPYKGERYHIPDFRGCNQPEGIEEVFNHAHSSLRNVIERTIGVWKNRWHILRDMKPFPLVKQEKIIVATIALHNFIRICGQDEEFDRCDRNPNYTPEIQEEITIDEEISTSTHRRVSEDGYMNRIRNQIATALMENRNR